MTLTQTSIPETSTPQRPQAFWGSIGLLAFSGISAVAAFAAAAVLALLGGLGQTQGTTASGQDPTSLLMLAWSAALIGVLLVPPVVLAGLNLAGRPVPNWMQQAGRWLSRLLPWSILLWPVLLGLGMLVSKVDRLSWLFMPPIHVLAVALPVAWFVSMGLRGLSPGRPLRGWGLFSTSLSANPLLVILIELFVFALVGIGVLVWVVSQPELQGELMRLVQRLSTMQDNPEAIMRILRPYVSSPAVAVGIILLLAGLVPLIEEMLKPLALWLLSWRQMTPSQGFAGGILCGAGLALIESLGSTSTFDPETWVSLVFQRGGTDLLHIVTTGMVGWALAGAWQNRKYLRLVLTYLAAVSIHGAWNGISLWSGFAGLNGASSGLAGALPLVLLGALVGLMFGLLLTFNKRLRRENDHAGAGGGAAAYPVKPASAGTV